MASSSSPAEHEEPRPSWAVLSRVAQYAGKDPGVLFLQLTKRPRLSHLTIPSRFGDYYYGGGEHPYIVAANDAGLLLRVSPGDLNLDGPDPEGGLVVARHFTPEDGTGVDGELTATTVRVTDREPELSHFSGVKSVGLLPVSAPSGFVVAELQVVEGEHGRLSLNLIWFRFSAIANAKGEDKDMEENSWRELELPCPAFTPGASPQWDPHDVVAFDGKLWWIDLSRGLLVCNPVEPGPGNLQPQVSFVALPDLVALQDRDEEPLRIDSRRIVRVSGGKLRFVDVVRRRGEPREATRVVVWTLESVNDPEIGGARWEHHRCMTTLGAIWDHAHSHRERGTTPRSASRERRSGNGNEGTLASPPCKNQPKTAFLVPRSRPATPSFRELGDYDHASYVASGMPRETPELAFLDPDKHPVVHFFLDAYLFSVDVNESAVVEFAGEPRGDVVQVQGGPQPINWRYVLTWAVPRFKLAPCRVDHAN